MNSDSHRAVMCDEAVSALVGAVDGVYIDATYGRGGHSHALLAALGDNARLLAIDQDPDAIDSARAHARLDRRLEVVHASFAALASILAERDLTGRVHGLLFDLGVSSPQLESATRGFSFRRGGALDMRMNPDVGQPVGAWLANADQSEIAWVIRRYGDEPMARRIAAAIVDARAKAPLEDSAVLAAIIAEAVPARVAAGQKIHPATRSFQAFRIFINDELGALDQALPTALDALAPGGRLAMISFHSLEDRRVKRAFRHQARPPQPPVPMASAPAPALRLIGKPRRADAAEIAINPRARSAIMRVAERTDAPVVAP